MIICCWAVETIENSSPRQCNTWGLQSKPATIVEKRADAADMDVLFFQDACADSIAVYAQLPFLRKLFDVMKK